MEAYRLPHEVALVAVIKATADILNIVLMDHGPPSATSLLGSLRKAAENKNIECWNDLNGRFKFVLNSCAGNRVRVELNTWAPDAWLEVTIETPAKSFTFLIRSTVEGMISLKCQQPPIWLRNLNDHEIRPSITRLNGQAECKKTLQPQSFGLSGA